MSKHLVRAGADTPDDHCCSCGTGLFDEVPIAKMHLLPRCSNLEDADFGMQLCELCERIELELIKATGEKSNPTRVAAYKRMQERQL